MSSLVFSAIFAAMATAACYIFVVGVYAAYLRFGPFVVAGALALWTVFTAIAYSLGWFA